MKGYLEESGTLVWDYRFIPLWVYSSRMAVQWSAKAYIFLSHEEREDLNFESLVLHA